MSHNVSPVLMLRPSFCRQFQEIHIILHFLGHAPDGFYTVFMTKMIFLLKTAISYLYYPIGRIWKCKFLRLLIPFELIFSTIMPSSTMVREPIWAFTLTVCSVLRGLSGVNIPQRKSRMIKFLAPEHLLFVIQTCLPSLASPRVPTPSHNNFFSRRSRGCLSLGTGALPCLVRSHIMALLC